MIVPSYLHANQSTVLQFISFSISFWARIDYFTSFTLANGVHLFNQTCSSFGDVRCMSWWIQTSIWIRKKKNFRRRQTQCKWWTNEMLFLSRKRKKKLKILRNFNLLPFNIYWTYSMWLVHMSIVPTILLKMDLFFLLLRIFSTIWEQNNRTNEIKNKNCKTLHSHKCTKATTTPIRNDLHLMNQNLCIDTQCIEKE